MNSDEHAQISQQPDLLAGIIGSVMDAIIAIDHTHRIVLFNFAAERIFVCPAKEALGNSIERFIPKRFRADHSAHIRRFAESRVATRTLGGLGTLWGLRTTGQEFPIEASISKIESGGNNFFAVVVRDITERRRAEDAARESEQRFRLVADTAPVMIWMSDTDKLCTYFNKPWLDFTGRSMEDELGNGWAEGVHPNDLQMCLQTYTQSFDRRENFRMEYRLRRHDGEYRWVLDIGVPRFNQDRVFAGYIGVGVDVTERKFTEEALRQSEERFRLAAQAGKMFAYEWDVATDVIVRSPEAGRILGTNEGTRITGQQTVVQVHPDDRERLKAAVAELSPEKPSLEISYRMVRPDGTVIWVERNSCAHFDNQGRMLRVVGMVADITDRKRLERVLTEMSRKLIEAQEQERARIARELHDDINQRLALLQVEIEQIRDNPSEVGSRALELGKKTSEISRDVQALAYELHSSKLEYLGAVVAMKSWCTEFGQRQGMQIDCRHDVRSILPPDIGLCLFRILQEALHNAARHSAVKRVEVQLAERSGEIHLIVKDLGKGFDTETIREGRGLGLTSMRERVRLVNGTIIIQSKPMGGTTIHVRVPLAAESSFQRAVS